VNQKKILILDYSVDRLETPNIKACLPADVQVSSLFIDTEKSFPDDLDEHHFTHIIHTGSALSINETAPFTRKAEKFIREIRAQRVPQMGICYGHQLVCRALIGTHAVRTSPNGFEVGWRPVTFSEKALELLDVKQTETVWQHHFDEVIELPEGSELLATNTHTGVQAYINFQQRLIGTQFHPEFDKERGDRYYVNDREFIEKNNHAVAELIEQGPSFDAGKVFFDFFLEKL
jgi:GMP synthase-like glutamine amidotransferase